MSESTEARDGGPSLVTSLRRWLEATGQTVEVVERHLSWVLLTATHAYKLKKPVRLPFVDFTTLAARKHFCDEELRLNQRMAPALYLGVLPVVGTPSQPTIGGPGTPIDHVVCMRRFPDSALLRNLVTQQQLLPAQLDVFARDLARFHASVPPAEPASTWGQPELVGGAAAQVLDQLCARSDDARLRGLQDWLRDQARTLHLAWIARANAGAVRECHGDLHLDNVVLVDGKLTAFDCLEFDPALRWIDRISDVAFLTMDLAAHGRADWASRFLSAWLEHSGDYACLTVLRFYETCRALVRALAASLRTRPGTPERDDTPDYLDWAMRRSHATAGGARLLITHGLSGSGKSSSSLQLLQMAGAIRIRSDVERKRLFGLAPLDSSAGRGADLYTADATVRTFERLKVCARTALQAGYPVIVDAAFLRRGERRSFEALAIEQRVPFTILRCSASQDTLRQRVAARQAGGNDASEADLAVLQRQLDASHALDADERAHTIELFTDGPIDFPALYVRWLAARP